MSKKGTPGLDRLTRVADQAIADDPRAATFVRGLALGALVGAAIAGSTIWQRRHGRVPGASDPRQAEGPNPRSQP